MISKVLIDVLKGRSLIDVAMPLIAIALLLAVRALAAGGAEYLGVKAATRIKGALRRRLYHKLLDLGPGWIGRTRNGLVQTALVDNRPGDDCGSGTRTLHVSHGQYGLVRPATPDRRGFPRAHTNQ